MTQLGDWIQNNWFESGILVVLCAMLIAVVWFARNVLKTLRASQEQVGALLRLSVSEVLSASPSSAALPQTRFSTAQPFDAERASAVREHAPREPNPLVTAGRNLVHWLNAPMRSRSESPLHRVSRWLQAPAGS